MTRTQSIFAILLVIALALLPLTGDRFYIYLINQVLIFALFAVSLNLLLGFAGQVSFGHAAYFAIGGYSCAILLSTYGWPLILAMPGAIVITALASAIIGFFCVRLTWLYFAMLTLAFAQLVWAVAFKWKSVTGGDDGFLGVVVPRLIGTPAGFYYFTFIVVLVCLGLLWSIVRSPFGRVLVATRENAMRADFVGAHVQRMHLVAFIISGTFSGVAGALFAMFNRSIFVEQAWWLQSAEVLIMVILGGMHSFFGPAFGAAVLIILERFINEYTHYWPAVLGLILLAVLFMFPAGLAGLAGLDWRRRRVEDARRKTDAATAESLSERS